MLKISYKQVFIGLAVCCILVLPFTYFWFIIDGCFPTGENISKGDWLGFWGGYLSFVGATILGVIAVWQNNQANKTNLKAIEENRRIYQIGFENELKRAQYLAIIHGVEEINNKLVEANKSFASMLQKAKETGAMDDVVKAYDSILQTLNFVYFFEFDRILPISFDERYPELKKYRENVKDQLKATIENVKNQKSELKKMFKTHDEVQIKLTVGNDQISLNEILSLFYNKLYSMNSYSFAQDVKLEESGEQHG